MAEGYLGEIRLFAGPRIPASWHACDGTLLTVQDNQALFALIGNRYGGDGIRQFALPDLRGRVPLHQGTGPGLTPRAMAAPGGSETAAVAEGQIPPHTHALNATGQAATTDVPTGNMLAAMTSPQAFYWPPASTGTAQTLDPQALRPAGGNQPHANVQPCVPLNFIICLRGDFPPRP